MSTTNDILDHHLKCFGERDLTGILADYDTNAVMFDTAEIRKGLDSIEEFFVKIFAEFASPGSSISMLHKLIEGDYAYILWTAETADNRYLMATDTFSIRDSKIVMQSFAAKTEPK